MQGNAAGRDNPADHAEAAPKLENGCDALAPARRDKLDDRDVRVHQCDACGECRRIHIAADNGHIVAREPVVSGEIEHDCAAQAGVNTENAAGDTGEQIGLPSRSSDGPCAIWEAVTAVRSYECGIGRDLRIALEGNAQLRARGEFDEKLEKRSLSEDMDLPRQVAEAGVGDRQFVAPKFLERGLRTFAK